ncbi:MAG: hypothetical protein Q9226_008812 [Calogaya cf. arnoldii]
MYLAGNFTDGEVLKCAVENGVVGRFQQHVGHTMTCVCLESPSRPKTYFGDWKVKSATKFPDITLWNDQKETMIAGEAKTPWTIPLADLMLHEEQGDRDYFIREFQKLIGQVAVYMSEFKYKYGFITTYEETVFLKQHVYEFTGETARKNRLQPGTKRDVLFYSNAIHHTTESTNTSIPKAKQSTSTFIDKVSTRECMFHMMKLVNQPGSQGYTMKGGKWTVPDWDGTTVATLLKIPKI